MNKLPTTPAEVEAWQAEMGIHEAALRKQVGELMPELQLDCLITAYLETARQQGKLGECGQVLIEIGGRLLFNQLGIKPAKTCSVPVAGQPMQHPTPSTVQ